MGDSDLLSEWVIALEERRERLAHTLLEVAYGEGSWPGAEDELIANYRADAWDILLANPHLMDLEMRTNLAHLGLIKED